MAAERVFWAPGFGHPRGVIVGQIFKNREELSIKNVHKPRFAGIAHCRRGATSVVLSGGYEDDEDNGDEILYTGTGGQEDAFNKPGHQTKDQTFEHRMNKALQNSWKAGLPVRVIRGHKHDSKFAPSTGYRYDGLYRVTECFEDKGKEGYKICRYRLVCWEDRLWEEDSETSSETSSIFIGSDWSMDSDLEERLGVDTSCEPTLVDFEDHSSSSTD
ncbi:hypothetical protein VNI00_006355 [Paramarasmius palmivorus]|uniref:YDG domain-containing protein n=1 Tax=Paramarasmius palmivorus TaxID=297713 RepID=A0AAW0D7B9_9AGAR